MHNLLPSNNVLKSIISIEQYSIDVLFDRFYDYIIVLDACDIPIWSQFVSMYVATDKSEFRWYLLAHPNIFGL